ncbi:MAG TPA: glycosyltransferase family 2 protein [Bacillota bacterium]|jgi:GT2 family glycosyltransferase|nr:glycosyltransferase family 2 protein [Bacillota bacterium]
MNKIEPLVYILILNWNGWHDTIECLESLQQLNYSNYFIVVVDNCSTNDSLQRIKDWAKGEQVPTSRFIVATPETKPVYYDEYYYEANSNRFSKVSGAGCDLTEVSSNRRMIVIQTDTNLGFAGGNNVGLRYILAQSNYDYVWLLNNDTVVKPDSLEHLVNYMRNNQRTGICGSTILYYDQPDIVQALGGATYNKLFGTTKRVGAKLEYSKLLTSDNVNHRMSCVIGASMFASSQFLSTIGLMEEKYFLYFEELDWATRAKGIFDLGYAQESIVYHKEGASIGSHSDPKQVSLLSDYYSLRNRVVFTRKFYPFLLPCIYFSLFLSLINRIRRRDFAKALMVLKLIFGIKIKKIDGIEIK